MQWVHPADERVSQEKVSDPIMLLKAKPLRPMLTLPRGKSEGN